MGLRSRPTYRVVVIDSRKARDGKYIESLGNYDPRSKLLNLDAERVRFWLGRGAQASDTVDRLVKRFAHQQTPAALPEAGSEPEAAPEAATIATPDTTPAPETAS
jgi:small subunit ribosomal protein S16